MHYHIQFPLHLFYGWGNWGTERLRKWSVHTWWLMEQGLECRCHPSSSPVTALLWCPSIQPYMDGSLTTSLHTHYQNWSPRISSVGWALSSSCFKWWFWGPERGYARGHRACTWLGWMMKVGLLMPPTPQITLHQSSTPLRRYSMWNSFEA